MDSIDSIIEEFARPLIGDAKALNEINKVMYEHCKDMLHVSWNPDWVNKVAALDSPEREVEIQKGINNLIGMEAMIARGDYTEITSNSWETASAAPVDVQEIINNTEI